MLACVRLCEHAQFIPASGPLPLLSPCLACSSTKSFLEFLFLVQTLIKLHLLRMPPLVALPKLALSPDTPTPCWAQPSNITLLLFAMISDHLAYVFDDLCSPSEGKLQEGWSQSI